MDIKREEILDQKNVTIFLCYAHADEKLRRDLEKHLSILQKQGFIDVWHDHQIDPGTEWEGEIDNQLNKAKIILLLVSPDFMASDYCYGVEMVRAMERHRSGEARVIPVILRPVHFKNAPFGKLQALPTNAIPVSSKHWHDLDEAFFDVAEGIHKAIQDLMIQYSNSSLAPSIPSSNIEEKMDTTNDEAYVIPLSHASSLKSPTIKQGVSKVPLRSVARITGSQQRSTPFAPYFPKILQKNIAYAIGLLILIIGSGIGLIGSGIGLIYTTHYAQRGGNTNIPQGTVLTTTQTNMFAIPNNWKIAINDPLRDDSKGYQWDQISSACLFEQGAYHVISTVGFFRECHSLATDFENFALQVQMTIIKGSCGGIMFRITGSYPADRFYKFEVCQNTPTLGANLTRYASDKSTDSTFLPSHISKESTMEIKLGQLVMLAVVANKSMINIYLNQQLAYSADDSTYTHGRIAFIANSYSQAAEVVYSNAKVWTPKPDSTT